MAVLVAPQMRRSPGLLVILLRLMIALLLLLVLAGAGLWHFGAALIAPVDDFEQGPGGAIAYISLAKQMSGQAPAFRDGNDIRLVLQEGEFSGMLSSALLSGRQPTNPIRKVRAGLRNGEIEVETILFMNDKRIPEQFQGMTGLRLWLKPTVTQTGQMVFAIDHAAVGRIPVPVALVRWAGKYVPISTPGFNARQATITLPISQMVTSNYGRHVQLKDFQVNNQQLMMVLAQTPKKQ